MIKNKKRRNNFMKMRKVMSVALVAAMCATMCPITASAKDDNVTIEYWQ